MHDEIVLIAMSKLNSIENTEFRGLTDSEITQEDFTTIINEARNYCKLNESVIIMKSQRTDRRW